MWFPDDTTLVAWLTGVLSPGEASLVEGAVSRSPVLRARVARLEERLGVLREASRRASASWLLPPPGRAWGDLHLRARAAPLMGEQSLRPGAYLQVLVSHRPDEDAVRLVVLRRVGRRGKWTVLHPPSARLDRPLSSLPVVGDGFEVLLVAPDEAGPVRWAVLLPPLAKPIAWHEPESERWAWLHRALDAGEVPVQVIEATVEGS